ncbi:MAG: hypothetical protein ABIT05_05180 [Chitinophagaceae bacterium]
MIKSSYALKLFPALFLFAFLTLNANAQNAGETQPGTIDDLKTSTLKIPALQEISGSPFLTTDYNMATIQTSTNKIVTDVPVKFNIYSNAVMVKMDDGQELKLEDFKVVSYDETAADGTVKHFRFEQGLPEVDNHSEKSVYQLVSSGSKVQLLKYVSQKVEDVATLGDYSRRELVLTEQLYVYVPGGTIKRIKASKKDLLEALPSMSAKIDEIASANNLKLKNEAEIAVLVEALNKP